MLVYVTAYFRRLFRRCPLKTSVIQIQPNLQLPLRLDLTEAMLFPSSTQQTLTHQNCPLLLHPQQLSLFPHLLILISLLRSTHATTASLSLTNLSMTPLVSKRLLARQPHLS